jgi:hypothetical protein
VRSGTKKQIADLEVEVKSAKTHSANVATAGEKLLKDFEDVLIRNLAELHAICAQCSGYCGLMLTNA